jgi:uncharacterized protein YciI
MPFLIDATDKSDSQNVRHANRPKHIAYLEENLPRLLAAGAKLRDDGETAWGTVYILDVEDRAAAEAFVRSDPFSRAGLFEEVAITRWRKAYFDFARQAPKI